MMNILQQGILILIHSAISGKAMSLPDGFVLEEAVPVISKHQLGNLAYYGAANCGIDTKLPVMRQLFSVTYKCILVDDRQRKALNVLTKAFEEKGIRYLPVKGVLMKKLYPQTDMRIMGDADIMIRMEQYDQIKQILEQQGYEFTVETDHEIVWNKPELHLELHKRLVPAYNQDFVAYYGDCWRLAKPTTQSDCRFELSNEDHLIYLLVHFAKHYRTGGIGIRHITDLYVCKKSRQDWDEQYITGELEKLGLVDFYEHVFRTLRVWFEQTEPDQITELMTEHIFSSGVYGTKDSRYMAEAIWNQKNSGKTSTQVRRSAWINAIFLPYKSMCINYPVLEKAPVLLPGMWVVRWIDVLFRKPNRLRTQSRKIGLLTQDQLETFEGRMNAVGLSFTFEENAE